ncbi:MULTISPECIES: hypothetical protein [unclassified Amycolatopsis]|uniref:hypothetical protein n=1 Tax=unclassified Amycolatopsis TaxID=2618356 RepID=UPI002E0F2319|nr:MULTISPECIES: hypothetical protein [unclassified Amycolatopsis]WSJ78822.1 hypothetical protein OG439_07485 [Amycolatopsis sp. NBC_01307]WSK77607.1 hypothetical protein OG570_40580 [Amycolatopsis sp. NBC_01286]
MHESHTERALRSAGRDSRHDRPDAPDDDLAALFGRLPMVFAVLSGPRHLVETANPSFRATVGMTAGYI